MKSLLLQVAVLAAVCVLLPGPGYCERGGRSDEVWVASKSQEKLKTEPVLASLAWKEVKENGGPDNGGRLPEDDGSLGAKNFTNWYTDHLKIVSMSSSM